MNDKGSPETEKKGWPRILAATGSPLKLFALTVLVCNSVFGVAAAWMENLEAFKYSIHMFLGIVAAFVLTALWSPRSLYHPKELLEISNLQREGKEDKKLFPVDRPWVPTILIVGGVIFYAAYQFAKSLTGTQ